MNSEVTYNVYVGPGAHLRYWANRLRLALAGDRVFEGTLYVWIYSTRTPEQVRRDCVGLPFWIQNDIRECNK